jgi:hypothetical protein
MTSPRKGRLPEQHHKGVRAIRPEISERLAQHHNEAAALPRGWVCCQCFQVHVHSRDGRACNFLHGMPSVLHHHCLSCKDVVILDSSQLQLIDYIPDHKIEDRGWFHEGCLIHNNTAAPKRCNCHEFTITSAKRKITVTLRPLQSLSRSSPRSSPLLSPRPSPGHPLGRHPCRPPSRNFSRKKFRKASRHRSRHLRHHIAIAICCSPGDYSWSERSRGSCITAFYEHSM